jgi:hypothetical protein
MRPTVEEQEGPGFKARISEKAESVKEKVQDKAESVKEKVQDTAYQVKERAGEMVDRVRDKASQLREHRGEYGGGWLQQASGRFNQTLKDQPLLLAVGGITLGMIVASLIPVTRRERQIIEPTKRKAKESLSQLGDKLEEKLVGATGGEREEELHASAGEQAGEERGEVPKLPPMEDYSRLH